MGTSIYQLFWNTLYLREGSDYDYVIRREYPILMHKVKKGDMIDLFEYRDGTLIRMLCLECTDSSGVNEHLKANVLKEWELKKD